VLQLSLGLSWFNGRRTKINIKKHMENLLQKALTNKKFRNSAKLKKIALSSDANFGDWA